MPETLVPALDELTLAYEAIKTDAAYQSELRHLLETFVGRETPLGFAPRISERVGAPVWLKREDLCHTGAHKINNALAQVLLAMRMGKRRIIAETGAGQHGVATATVCAKFGLECVVYMGEEDTQRQSLNVFRMQLLGARVVPVTGGTRTLKDATSEAIRDWVTNVESSHYIIGSVVGPAPYPRMVRDFQACIGREAREQMLRIAGRLPRTVVACVGGRLERDGHLPRLRSRHRRAAGRRRGGRRGRRHRPATRPRSPRARPACCTARSPCCCRTSTARCIRHTASRQASTIRAWARSTRT